MINNFKKIIARDIRKQRRGKGEEKGKRRKGKGRKRKGKKREGEE